MQFYVSKLDPVSNFLFVCFTDFDGSNFVKNLEASVANKKKRESLREEFDIFITVKGGKVC